MILYYILVPLAWLVFHIGFRVRCEGREKPGKKSARRLHHCPQPHLRHRPGVRRHHPVLGPADDSVCQERAVRDKPIPVVVLPVRRCSLCPRHERRGQCHRRHREKGVRRAVRCCSSRRGHGSRRISSFPSRAASSSSRRQQMWTSCLAASTTTPLMVDEAVLQGACHLRRAHARCTVCDGRPPRHKEAAGE